MHPSDRIRGAHSHLLAGRRIVIGVSGSIAATELPRVARELIRHGADVWAVMSPDATRLVTEEAIAFATGHRPITQLSGDVEHVSMLAPGPSRADLLLIAPATANTISKIAHGIDDTPVTTFASVALGGGVPILLAPAMHAHMAQNPAVRENLDRLRRFGVGIVEASSAEGEEKLANPEEMAAAVLHRIAQGPWAGRKVIVIGGASREPIDAVRSVTNESTGMTAVALATQAHFRGAHVELWAGALQVPVPPFVTTETWRTVSDLLRLSRRRSRFLRSVDLVLVPAALSDFTLPARSGKISSRNTARFALHLTRTPKILADLRHRVPPPALVVGFKLEAGRSEAELLVAAKRLLEENDLDWVVANDLASLHSPETDSLVVGSEGRHHWIAGPKVDVAGKLLDDLGRELRAEGVERAGPPGPDGAVRTSTAPRRTAGPRRSRRASRAR